MKCGRNRKWTSGSESMIQRRMARREKEGIALRGVAWRASRVKEEVFFFGQSCARCNNSGSHGVMLK